MDSAMVRICEIVPERFVGLVLGKHKNNIRRIEDICHVKITWAENRGKEICVLTIEGDLRNNCEKAREMIRETQERGKGAQARAIDQARKEELGGGINFACFNCFNEKDIFQLVEGKTGRFGKKYRIESDADDHKQMKLFSVETISTLTSHLSKSFQRLHEIKDGKQLTVDLGCFFCKILVGNIDEDESKNETFTGYYIRKRIANVFSGATDEAYWVATFGESIDPVDLNDGVISENNNSSDEVLKRDGATVWRYDYGFVTPSGRKVRLNVWHEDPHAENNESPDEAKNILQQVHFKGEESSDVKAWLCYPATTVIKGDLMIPYSKYDCRIKLRADPRRVIEENEDIRKELKILADYLSNCKLDKINHTLDLPNQLSHEIPNDFACSFYREAEKRKYCAEMDAERYTVIFSQERGWTLKSSEKKDEKEFKIKVMMNPWSDTLLSQESNWEMQRKLHTYMEFVSLLYFHLFH